MTEPMTFEQWYDEFLSTHGTVGRFGSVGTLSGFSPTTTKLLSPLSSPASKPVSRRRQPTQHRLRVGRGTMSNDLKPTPADIAAVKGATA